MGLDLWFREDVARILASAHETMRSLTNGVASANPEQSGAYQQGFEDALRAVGIAFGVAAPAARSPNTSAHASTHTWDGTRRQTIDGTGRQTPGRWG